MNEGCQPFSSECSDARGNTVNLNQSVSRKEFGLFDLGLELNLGRNESGDYGLDSLALGLNNATGGPALDSQIVVGIETNHYRVGMFGLSQQPTNVSTYSNSYSSFLTSLKTQNLIPSLSWAYTAGARYSKSQDIYLQPDIYLKYRCGLKPKSYAVSWLPSPVSRIMLRLLRRASSHYQKLRVGPEPHVRFLMDNSLISGFFLALHYPKTVVTIRAKGDNARWTLKMMQTPHVVHLQAQEEFL